MLGAGPFRSCIFLFASDANDTAPILMYPPFMASAKESTAQAAKWVKSPCDEFVMPQDVSERTDVDSSITNKMSAHG